MAAISSQFFLRDFIEKVLKFDRPFGPEGCGIAIGAALRPGFRGFRRFRGFKGLWYRPAGDEYEVSVTGLAFAYSMLHDGEP